MKFSEKLVQLRHNKNVSRKTIAQILEMTEVAYGCYERGERMPSIDKLCKLADYFEISIDELLCRNVELQKAKEKWQNAGYDVKINANNKGVTLTPTEDIETKIINSNYSQSQGFTTTKIIWHISTYAFIDITKYADMLFKKDYDDCLYKIYSKTLSKFENVCYYEIEDIPL